MGQSKPFRRTAIVVEDDAIHRDTIALLLEESDFEVIRCEDAETRISRPQVSSPAPARYRYQLGWQDERRRACPSRSGARPHTSHRNNLWSAVGQRTA